MTSDELPTGGTAGKSSGFGTVSSLAVAIALAAISMAWLIVWGAMPAGLISVDELIQVGSLVGLERGFGFTVPNSAEGFGSPDLRLLVMVDGPNGLTSQYPAGFTFLAYPFWLIGGIRGVFLLNLLSAFAAVLLTYLIALRMTDRRTAFFSVLLLTLASFLVDYAVAFWPHALSLAVSLGIVYCLLRLDAAGAIGRRGLDWAVLAGLLAGTALTVRLDTLTLLPPVAIWLIWYGRTPLAHMAAAFLGMTPGLVFSALVNVQKFDSFNPISYGQPAGGLTFGSRYLWLSVFIIVAMVCLYVLRFQSDKLRRIAICTALVAIAIACALFPPIGAKFLGVLDGVHTLIFDMAVHPEAGVRVGVDAVGDQTTVFWGAYKQSLVQSMPWLFVVVLAFRKNMISQRWLILCVLIICLVALPFLITSWHGGKSNSQRYLLLVCPFLAVLGAVGLRELFGAVQGHYIYWVLGVPFAIIAWVISVSLLGVGAVMQPIPKIIFASGLCFTLLALITGMRLPLLFATVLFVPSLVWSFLSCYAIHLTRSALDRGFAVEASEVFAKLPSRTLIHTGALEGAFQAFYDDQMILAVGPGLRSPDPVSVTAVLDRDWRIATTYAPIATDLLKDSNLRSTVTASESGRIKVWIIEGHQP